MSANPNTVVHAPEEYGYGDEKPLREQARGGKSADPGVAKGVVSGLFRVALWIHLVHVVILLLWYCGNRSTASSKGLRLNFGKYHVAKPFGV